MAASRRRERLENHRGAQDVQRFSNQQRLGYESDEDIRAGLEWGQEKARLLLWVRKQMGKNVKLTPKQKGYLGLIFFHGLTYRGAAAVARRNQSTVHRGVARAIRVLKEAAAKEGMKLK